MSIFSDYKCGALSDFEFREECKRMNREERDWDAPDRCRYCDVDCGGKFEECPLGEEDE